jgi:SAM-dependent methyltransferase
MKMRSPFAVLLSLAIVSYVCEAFVPQKSFGLKWTSTSSSRLRMAGLDLVTYLRTEWISAALFTNQTPRSADVALQLGSEDGRIVTFLPKTIREIITSTSEPDCKLSVSARRQLKTQQERRGTAKITYADQASDDLRETADETVDVVVSMHAAAKMKENGLDWRKSVREAARVLKPGGRFLFVEQTEIDGESYLNYVEKLVGLTDKEPDAEQQEVFPVFDEVGFDDVDLVIIPHIAGVAIKSEEVGLSPAERARRVHDEEKERIADLSIAVYERGIKKRKKKKIKTNEEAAAA